jgi:ElaB/YqjD/DUF883 family membrane-anchored ribosome-binding protein
MEPQDSIEKTADNLGLEAGEATQTAEGAMERLSGLGQMAAEKTKDTARKTDQCVHDHTWKAIAASAAMGFLVGLLLRERGSSTWD